MKTISFFDLEIDPKHRRILDIGCINSNGSKFHKNSVKEFLSFVKESDLFCGHNIMNHDLQYITLGADSESFKDRTIDTLFLSALLFPKKPYHRLVKDEKLQT